MVGDTVALNERGLRIGEGHPNAKITDEHVDLIREMYEEFWSYGALAKKFGVAKSTIRDIVKCRRRAQTAFAFR